MCDGWLWDMDYIMEEQLSAQPGAATEAGCQDSERRIVYTQLRTVA